MMPHGYAWAIAWQHAKSRCRRSALTVFGLGLGVAILVVSLALGLGVRRIVFTQMLQVLPADTIEARAQAVDLGFVQLPAGGSWGGAKLSQDRTQALARLPHVRGAFAKRHVALPLGAKGGAQLFGRALYADLFVTALPEPLVRGPTCAGFVDLPEDAQTLPNDAVIPLVISPGLIALYNASVAPSLGTPILEAQTLVGFTFDLVIGRSMMLGERGARAPGTQRAQIVGVSPFAAPLGATMPARYADKLWDKYASDPVAHPLSIASIIVQAQAPEHIAGVTDALVAQGLVVDEAAKRMRHVLWGATCLWATGGFLVLMLAASQILFGVMVYMAERRRQWAILQAIGLSTSGLLTIVLGQALALGAAGAALGLGAARLIAFGVDSQIAGLWPAGLVVPSSLFCFTPQLACATVAAACGASLLGAVGPALTQVRTPVHQGLKD